MRELGGSVVVVVGATGALGSLIATELRDRGAVVLGAGRHGPDVVCDLRDVDAGHAVVRGALGTQGRLDGVVNAAGIVAFGDLVGTDPVVVEELFLVNALGPLWLAQAVLPTLAERRGFFANISGVVAEQSLANMVPYCASKAAVSHAMPGLRREARRSGVHVLDARPPHTETGLAGRAIAGTAPTFPQGLDPAAVARRIVEAIVADEAELASGAFG
ncbi:MAG: SDR family NAD(P)-dependent oxidoreductase [Actinobacteria bacterium]|nr:SDR family NAD(P)-dependent oxidoreductase [Actinomycetota bacterium]